MTDDPVKSERDELESLRARLDHLRVQGNLGRKELRDRLRELEATLWPAYRRAAARLQAIATDGAEDACVLARSLRAGWDELVRSHRELTREVERGRAGRRQARRS